jgi:ribosome-associated protein YbcJ (S4-like RNA binding protein)
MTPLFLRARIDGKGEADVNQFLSFNTLLKYTDLADSGGTIHNIYEVNVFGNGKQNCSRILMLMRQK